MEGAAARGRATGEQHNATPGMDADGDARLAALRIRSAAATCAGNQAFVSLLVLSPRPLPSGSGIPGAFERNPLVGRRCCVAGRGRGPHTPQPTSGFYKASPQKKEREKGGKTENPFPFSLDLKREKW